MLNDGEPADEATRHMHWRRWLHLYNTFQTLTGVLLATTDGRQDEAAVCWNRAFALKDATLGFDDEFYAAELEQVVLAQGIATLDAYRAARRTGRGVVLSRAKRDASWPVFEEYRAQLASRRLKEADAAYRDAAQLIEKERHHPYSAIVVDETQDFGPQALRLLRCGGG